MRLTRFVVVWCLCGCTSFAQLTVRPLLNLPGETEHPSLSPDGKTLAFSWFAPDNSSPNPGRVVDDWGIYVRPVGGGTPQRFDLRKSVLDASIEELGVGLSPQWSPDGKGIAFTRSGTPRTDYLRIKAVTGGEERGLGTITGGSLAWSADAGAVIAAGYYGPDSEGQDRQRRPTLWRFPCRRKRALGSWRNKASTQPCPRMGRWLPTCVVASSCFR